MSLTLTENQREALKEVSHIGMGHAATALSQLLGETILLRVPQITLTDITRIPEFLGGAGQMVAGITLQVLGEARGNLLLVFPRASAQRLLARLLGRDGRGLVMDELGISTLKEVGNILASAYLTALSRWLGLTLIPSTPLLAYDMAGAVVDHIVTQLSLDGDCALLMETEFHTPHGRPAIGGHLFLLPDAASLGLILRPLDRSPVPLELPTG